MTGLARWGEWLGLRRETTGLLLLVVLVGMGERLAERFLPIYLLALGGGSLVVGLLGAMQNLLAALYSVPGGYLAERFGVRRSLLMVNLVAMVGYGIVILVPRWEAVLVGAILFLAWSSLSLPASMGLIAKVLPPTKRTMGVAMHSLVRRIPMALGPLLGGICIGWLGEEEGVRLAFVVALVLALVGLLAQQRLLSDDLPRGVDHRALLNPFRIFPLIGPSLRRLLVADILIRFCEQIPYAFVVVWCMKTIAEPVSAVQFGILTTVEMVTAVLIYLPVASLADRLNKKPFVVATFIFFTLFPLVLWFSESFPALVAAFVLRGFKEFGEPTRKAMILDLAPPDRRETVFGVYYLVRDGIVAAAAFGGAVLWEMGAAANLLTAFACGVAGTIWFAVWGQEA